jgi:uncharacterized protein YndB with AHSA1/START domain
VATAQTTDNLTLNVNLETLVRASIESTFESVIAQMGRLNETLDGKPMPMVIEPWPGGRWFRDLGGDNGHFWGHVQAIKRPTLLEICGPLFMSSPVVSNVQYRLKEVDGGTLIVFRHTALGFIPDEYRQGMGGLDQGWKHLFDRIRKDAEREDKR